MSSPVEALSLPLTSLILGSALHVSSLKLQLDGHGWRLLGLWNLTLALLFFLLIRSHDILTTTRLVLTFASAFLLGFFGSTSVYRLLFSPLRKFRGPWQGVLTSFYRLHAAIETDVRLFRKIDSLHKTYGDYVRVGGREISILNPSAIPLLYGAKAQCKRGAWYHHTPYPEEDRQVLLITDPSIHSWRRRILDRGFSSKVHTNSIDRGSAPFATMKSSGSIVSSMLRPEQGDCLHQGGAYVGPMLPFYRNPNFSDSRVALADYEPRVQEVINDLIQALKARTGSSVNLTDWISFFAFDVMGRVAYNHEFGMIKDGKGTVSVEGKATSLEALRATMKMYGIFGPVPWFFKMIGQIGLVGEMAIFFQWCHETMRMKQKSFDPVNDTPTDISSWIIKSQSDASDINKRQTQRSMENDSILLILAGSDTAASAITNAIFYLTRDPDRLAKLRTQIEALPDRSLKSLATVRYLDHVINETLRLKPPAIEGLVRETPAGGITIPNDGTFIPGGTTVSIPPWTLHRDARFWGEDAEEFRPERFEGVDLTNETLPFIPFTRGSYTCPGKQLAYMEMRGVISAVVMDFDLTLSEGQGEKEFDEGCKDSFTLENPPLNVVLKRRGTE